MDDHNTGEGVKATPIWMHNYEEPVLAQQIDQTSPESKDRIINYNAPRTQ